MNVKHMIKTSSEHYDFYYLKNSIAQRDINQIVKLQEACYLEITKVLNIEVEFRIQYYLLDTPELVGKVYGDGEACNGFANEPDEIYAVYNDEIKCVGYHEDTHILSYTINRPKSNFVREGLAMFFDKFWWNQANEVWVKRFLKEGKYISVKLLLLDEYFLKMSDAITYPIAGAFTKYLIDHYGIDRYLSYYKFKGDSFDEHFKNIYTKEVVDLEKDFILTLSS